MDKFKRLVLAYIFASVVALILGFVLAILYGHLAQTKVTEWAWMAMVWLVLVGAPSAFAAVDDLTKQLGKKQNPLVQVRSSRLIPVGAHGGSTFNYVMGKLPHLAGATATQTRQIELKEIEIQSGDYILSEGFISGFLRTAWSRQRSKKPPLSRTWWVDGAGGLERGEYEAMTQMLNSVGLLNGRKQGRSGKLLYPPSKALAILRNEH